MRALILGGAGYIGAHMVALLREQSWECVVVDDLSGGRRASVDARARFVEAGIDDPVTAQVLVQSQFDAVFHFAGSISVGESMTEPMRYYANNVGATAKFLCGLERLGKDAPVVVFSSTAAVYGEPQQTLIREDHPKAPLSPYGLSKLMAEQMLASAHTAWGLRYACLRYFNAAGAHADGTLGECHEPETHLIPLVLQVASGRRASVSLFGTDYPTHDGTCIRDFVHVQDLCSAHLAAAMALIGGIQTLTCNLGTGAGYSVRQLVDAAQRITERPIAVVEQPRRVGDPAVLVADASAARTLLGWTPVMSDLDTIVAHAWQWEQRYPWVKS
jgi:UDP-glucose 4-epimerase